MSKFHGRRAKRAAAAAVVLEMIRLDPQGGWIGWVLGAAIVATAVWLAERRWDPVGQRAYEVFNARRTAEESKARRARPRGRRRWKKAYHDYPGLFLDARFRRF